MDDLVKFVEQIIKDKPFEYIQRFILQQSLYGKTYSEMAQDLGYTSDYIKEIGSQLWQDLSDILGQRVTKKKLYLVLNKLQKKKRVRRKYISKKLH